MKPINRPKPWVLLCLLLIVVAALAGSIYWTATNVVLVGRDSAGHLEQSLFVGEALARGLPQGLFEAITLDDYRPPALYLLTQPAYWVLGRSMDAAQAPNLLLLAVILLLTFVLARRVLSDALALLAVLLLALLPMVAAMTRFYYMENLLTAALLLGLWALLNSTGFAHRGWSLAFGVSVGVLLLIKWTAPIYLLAPVLYVLWRQVDWRAQAKAVAGLRIDWPRAGLSLLAGALLALLWYWPNRAYVFDQEMALGDWLALGWSLLWGATIYTLWPQKQAGTPAVRNFAGALLLGLALASLWYLPRIDFLQRLSAVAFGSDRGTQEALDLLRLSNYTRYFGFWLSHHMGPLATLLIVPPALLGSWLYWRTRQGRGNLALTLYWLMLLFSWLLLTLIAQANPRNLHPLLPVIAILLAAGLRGFARPLAAVLAALWVLVLGLQWSIYTFDALAPLQARTPHLWVAGDYLQWPATASTDPGFWIHPAVLATIGSPSGEPDSLGMLVDTWELHRGTLRYLATLTAQNVTINALTENDMGGWGDVLANRWLLVKDGDNSEVKPPGQALIADIEQGNDLFDQLYHVVRRFALPSGDTVTLYQRSDGPSQPQEYPVILLETQPVAETLNAWWSPGSTLLFGDRDTAVWLGVHGLAADRVLLPDAAGEFAQPLDELAGTIFLVTRYEQAARAQVAAGGYYARDFVSGDTTLAVFGRPQQPLVELEPPDTWPGLAVESLRSLPALSVGEVLPLELELRRTDEGEPPLKLSLRLLNAAGESVAQNDVDVADAVRLGLFAPPDLPPGAYTLAAVLYDPTTLEPRLTDSGQQAGVLAEIAVNAPAPSQ